MRTEKWRELKPKSQKEKACDSTEIPPGGSQEELVIFSEVGPWRGLCFRTIALATTLTAGRLEWRQADRLVNHPQQAFEILFINNSPQSPMLLSSMKEIHMQGPCHLILIPTCQPLQASLPAILASLGWVVNHATGSHRHRLDHSGALG